jgi:hypothetical protein
MKKLAIIAMVLMVIPLTALARMDSMSEDAMGVIHGQSGITIDFRTQLEDSYLAITDDNGFTDTTVTANNTGAFTLDGLTISGTQGGAMTVDELLLDVGTDASNKSYLGIGLPIITGKVDVAAVRIGTSAARGNSLGQVTWGRIKFAATDCRVYSH